MLNQIDDHCVSARAAPIGGDSNSDREHGRSLEELILDLLQGEFAGVIRSHVRGEVYGGR